MLSRYFIANFLIACPYLLFLLARRFLLAFNSTLSVYNRGVGNTYCCQKCLRGKKWAVPCPGESYEVGLCCILEMLLRDFDILGSSFGNGIEFLFTAGFDFSISQATRSS